MTVVDPAVASAADETAERTAKRARVGLVLDAAGAEAVWLTSPAAIGWYLGGARVHTSLAGPPIAAVRVTREGELVRVHTNELDRMIDEELPEGVATEAVDWFAPLVDARDTASVLESAVEGPLRAARAQLLPLERARYADLGADTARALTDALGAARPDETERDLAARVGAGVVATGADPLVVMVAGARRLGHRHPLPTAAPLGERAMVVVCARRHGLIANATRWVRTAVPSRDEAARAAALHRVEAEAWRATRPGRALGEVLIDIAGAYEQHGFGAAEWRRHHQGGAAGYAGRDPRATPGAADLVHDGQAFAWNPTAPGVKIEDTVIIDDGRVEVLTRDDRWPETEADGVARPDELVL
jgi:Xaa-Pro aminopeptidase